MESKKVFVSQPLRGYSSEQIMEVRAKAVGYLEGLSYTVLNPISEPFGEELADDPNVLNDGLFALGESLKRMSEADVVFFCKGWRSARGCVVEHEAAKLYDMTCLYEA